MPGTMDVRCACGQVYHADPAHLGRQIRCRCGRTVTIQPQQVPSPGGRRAHRRLRLRLTALRLSPRALRALTFAAWAYLAVAAAVTLVLWTLGDVWWPATVLLYSHRWLLLVPLAPLALLALFARPRLLLPVAGSLAIILGPGMGYRVGWRGFGTADAEADLRIITFNIAGRENWRYDQVPGILVEDLGADLILFQECFEGLVEAARKLPGWTVWDGPGGLCTASRFPIDTTLVLEEIGAEGVGTVGSAAFHRIRLPDGPLAVGNLHLETPRSGFEALRYRASLAQLRRNKMFRDAGSARASQWLARLGAEIVAGDFNMPVESRIYRRYWTRCDNAFSRVGRGFGYTRVLYRFSIRIDHLLICSGWTAVGAQVGPDLASDHLPVIVDLRRR